MHHLCCNFLVMCPRLMVGLPPYPACSFFFAFRYALIVASIWRLVSLSVPLRRDCSPMIFSTSGTLSTVRGELFCLRSGFVIVVLPV